MEELRPLLLLLARLPVLVRGRLAALVALLPLLLEAVGLEAPPALLALRRPAVHQVEVVLLRAARSALQAGRLAAYGRRARSVRRVGACAVCLPATRAGFQPIAALPSAASKAAPLRCGRS